MITDFYGLTFNPFEKNNVRTCDCFRSSDFLQTISGMNYVRDHMGIGVFTARPGMGKSFCIHSFVESQNPNLYTIAYISLTSISVRDFYRLFCEALGIDSSGSIPAMYKAIQEEVRYLYEDKKKPLVLIIDECQNLMPGILRDLMLLMNMKYDSFNYFSVIFSGESYFRNILHKASNEALRQRITVHYDFQGLSDDEVPQYIKHKLACAGGTRIILEDTALNSVHNYVQGTPRLIDNLMTDTLILGEQKKMVTITQDVLLTAVEIRR